VPRCDKEEAASVTEERRRHPRFEIESGEAAVLPVALSVRILDISLAGVLVQARQAAKEGDRGRLRLDLGGMPFTADVEVKRVVSGGAADNYKIGIAFVGLSSEHRQMIQRFTQQ
jgi:hypothetical protein